MTATSSRVRAAVLGVAAALALPFATKTWQWDDWWHLATGRWMVETHRLPTFDAFSFTARGEAWHAASWGSDLLFYAFYAAFGIAGLPIAKVVAAFAALALIATALLELGVASRETGATLVAAFVFLQARNTTARPEIFAAVLLAALVAAVARATRRHDHALALGAPIAWAWVPMHSSAVLAPIVIGVGLIALALGRAPRRVLASGTATLVAALAPFALTATGRDIVYVASIHNATKSPLAFALTYEWNRSPLLSAGACVPTTLLAAGLMVGVGAATLAVKRKLALRTHIFPLGIGLLGATLWAQADRHLATAVLLNVPLWGLALDAAARHLHGIVRAIAAPAAGLAVVATQLVVAPYDGKRFDIGLGVDEAMLPGDTLASMRRMIPGRVMNEFHLGGYLIWNRIHDGVFWDGRNLSLYTERHLREIFLYARSGERPLEEIADRYGIDYGMATFNGDFGYLLMQSNDWLPVHYGVSSVLFVRRSRKARALDAGLPALEELRFLPNDAFLTHWYAPIVSDPARTATLERELVASVALAPGSPVLEDVMTFFDEFRPELARRLRLAAAAAAGANVSGAGARPAAPPPP